MEEPGFEPGTFRMRSGHSTTELHPRLMKNGALHSGVQFHGIFKALKISIAGLLPLAPRVPLADRPLEKLPGRHQRAESLQNTPQDLGGRWRGIFGKISF